MQNPNHDDWKKLGRCLRFLRDTIDDVLTLEADRTNVVKWWVDASFAVHPNMRSHTSATMSMGNGNPINISSKQKINTRSSTEAELVGVNDAMYLILWVRHFLEAQGYEVKDNVVYQDNQSTMKLAKNGKKSSTKNTRHIKIRYFFITDNILRGKLSVEYCPTDDMLEDYYTKPQQGSKMRRSRIEILNLSGKKDPALVSQECVGTPAPVLPVTGATPQVEYIQGNTCKGSTIQGGYGDRNHRANACNMVYGTGDMRSGCSNSHQFSRRNDVSRHQTRSYLMAAKGLLNKVSHH